MIGEERRLQSGGSKLSSKGLAAWPTRCSGLACPSPNGKLIEFPLQYEPSRENTHYVTINASFQQKNICPSHMNQALVPMVSRKLD